MKGWSPQYGTYILLYLQVPKHPARGDTPQYYSGSIQLASATEKNQKSFKEINRMRKRY